ncbi:cytochrome C peroxidase [Fulvivirgaceae bacterium PWU4]|uniref:Cytochrome C peroxidase n=1 Tax=Chryseosolibacter histidini TaxID=2782349 RepID=A0AAP2DMW6_9BACT|nr:cytochrome c peroxidase [Chryseosolibacter histidini]MBT1697812.1 cytochrome C peroxidase [Chryseosolibacter histidini]
MKNILIVVGLAVILVSCQAQRETPSQQYKKIVAQQIDSLLSYTEHDFLSSARSSQNSEALQEVFFGLRKKYKRVELVTEYFMPVTSRFVNGPALPVLDTEEHKVQDPQGLQVMEEFIFPQVDTASKEELVRHTEILLVNLKRMRSLWKTTSLTDTLMFDAARLQLFRIITLGISGFDSPVAHHSMPEAAASLKAVNQMLGLFKIHQPSVQLEALREKLTQASAYLEQHNTFDTFDRAAFITKHIHPVLKQLSSVQAELGIPFVNDARMLKTSATTLFDPDVFIPDFFLPGEKYQLTDERIALGRKLFYDPVISGDGKRSCASCHRPEKGFTDGLKRSPALGGGLIARNAPTLLNASLQNSQFYDMRATTLEVQARDVVSNKDEMHSSVQLSAERLQRNPAYRTLFIDAYKEIGNSVTADMVQNALASYVRSLVSLNSRFDQYMRGDSSRLSREEIAGFNLFMGKAQCGICHFMPLFNGTVPPSFTQTESEVIGVPDRVQWQDAAVDPDEGRYKIHPLAPLRFAFKTPTVRNAALTAPYMHNGVYANLDDVMEFYNQGGGAGIEIELPNQTLPDQKLNLSSTEKEQVIAFIRSLTDTTTLQRP